MNLGLGMINRMREIGRIALSTLSKWLEAANTRAAIKVGVQTFSARLLIPGSWTAGFQKIDYVEVRDAETLAPVEDKPDRPLRILAAVWLGKTRLIDNVGV